MTWEEFNEGCKNCHKCSLCETRTNVVPGTGNINADLMFIGEAPGEQEDSQGIPFVGRAGKLFDKFLVALDINRDDVYIANMLKCRPPQNRDPLPQEQDMCIDWLRAQVKLIRPKMIVCLGRISACRLIKEDFKITQEHGVWFEKGGIKMCGIYHPSYLLRNPSKRQEMYLDMKMIKSCLDDIKNI